MTEPDFQAMMPETVHFTANGIECIAFVMNGRHCGLNMTTCLVNFEQPPVVEIKIITEGPIRVSISGKPSLWFDTDHASAKAIQWMFHNASSQRSQ